MDCARSESEQIGVAARADGTHMRGGGALEGAMPSSSAHAASIGAIKNGVIQRSARGTKMPEARASWA